MKKKNKKVLDWMEKKTIFVRGYITNCLIGIYPNEKNKKQKIKISINLSLAKVKNKDIINSTVSYEKIISVLDEIRNYKHINLLETLARKIVLKLEKLNNIKDIKIEIVKCNILKGKQEVGITLEKKLNRNL